MVRGVFKLLLWAGGISCPKDSMESGIVSAGKSGFLRDGSQKWCGLGFWNLVSGTETGGTLWFAGIQTWGLAKYD